MRSKVIGAAALLAVWPSVRLAAFQCPDGTPPPCGRAHAPSPNSVAVLVFENRARDSSLTLLAEGLADEITTNLGRVARLEVKSAASVRAVLGGGAREPHRLGQALGARYLVDGALLPARGSVRVSVQLVEAVRGTVRWTGVYQRSTEDLFRLITTIADSVAVAIVGRLAPAEQASRGAMPTRSPAAFEAYVKGRAALRRFDEASLRQAVALFEQATALDSAFVSAWAGLADAWSWSDVWQPPRVALPRARMAAERALRLDSTNAEALTAMAGIATWYDWNFPECERLARRALASSVRLARAHFYLGESLVFQGRRAEAAEQLGQALAADTLDEGIGLNVMYHLVVLGAFDEAMQVAERWRTVAPRATWPVATEWHLRAALGRCAGSQAPRGGGDFGDVLCRSGVAAAHAYVDSVVAARQGAGQFLVAGTVSDQYAIVGDREQALRWLERSMANREGDGLFSLVLPWWAELRTDPRFVELWRNAGVAIPAVR